MQAGTSHNLGTNFATAFGTRFENDKGELVPVHQTSWGMSTRMVGGVIMTHGDDAGLRLPPALAPVQATPSLSAHHRVAWGLMELDGFEWGGCNAHDSTLDEHMEGCIAQVIIAPGVKGAKVEAVAIGNGDVQY